MERITELIRNFEESLKREVTIESLDKIQADLSALNQIVNEITQKRTQIAGSEALKGSSISFDDYFENINAEVNQIQEQFSTLIDMTKQMETQTALKQFLITKLTQIYETMLDEGSRSFNLSTYDLFKEFLQELRTTMEQDLVDRIEKELFTIKTGLGEFGKVYEVADQQFRDIQQFLEHMRHKYTDEFQSIRLKTEIIEQQFPEISRIFASISQDNAAMQKEVEQKLANLRQAPIQLLADLQVELDKYQKDVLIEQIQLKAAQEALESNLEQTAEKLKVSEKETQMSQAEIRKMQEEHAQMKAELEYLSKQLESVTNEFQSLSKEKTRRVEMREVIALVMTLLTEVFGAQPHSKLLYLLHGQKGDMDRTALTQATGIGGAIVRKALADLAAAKLVNYNVESGQVSLLKRIYD